MGEDSEAISGSVDVLSCRFKLEIWGLRHVTLFSELALGHPEAISFL